MKYLLFIMLLIFSSILYANNCCEEVSHKLFRKDDRVCLTNVFNYRGHQFKCGKVVDIFEEGITPDNHCLVYVYDVLLINKSRSTHKYVNSLELYKD